VVLGLIADLETDVYVYVKNTATGRIERQPNTSEFNGNVTLALNIPDESFYHPNAEYQVWVTLATAGNMYDTQTITLVDGVTASQCLLVSFERVIEVDNTFITSSQQTASV